MTDLSDRKLSRAAKRLAEEMRHRGLSDEACGKLIGCSQSCVSRIRRGKRVPRPELMARINQTLGIAYDDWFSLADGGLRDAA